MVRETTHRVILSDGLIFEIGTESRIERAVSSRREIHPDHIWEPQTTRLLKSIARGANNVIMGGAYIGDHAVPVAHTMMPQDPTGLVHAFEPMPGPFERLEFHARINSLPNLVCHRTALWDESGLSLAIVGDWAVASASPDEVSGATRAPSITIDDFVAQEDLDTVQLIHLDLEGGEERALRGAVQLLTRPESDAPALVFEIHREHIDWSEGLERTTIVTYLAGLGYEAWAVRDFHGNEPMAGRPIEIVPLDAVYLGGPPHGFNVLATKDPSLTSRLDLRVVRDVSPKLLWDRDPALHHPRH